MKRRALLSVYDKTGIVELARGLVELGWELISTGGTYRTLQAAGIPVLEVAEVAGFPEILDGRVKTLQPQIHAGILAVRNNPRHMAQLAEHGVRPIDLVVVNLYPFQATVARPEVTLADAVEQIDIGGPALIRAAAKNWQDVAVVVEPARYGAILAELRERGDLSPATRFALMQAAFRHTAAYDAAIAAWMEGRGQELFAGREAAPAAPAPAAGGPGTSAFPERLTLSLVKVRDLRYGENPHQRAAFYRDLSEPLRPDTLAGARQLHGKELSFNNIHDAHAALELVREFTEPAAVAVKHTNPCGVAVAPTIAEAYRRARDADPVSIFGGIVALNRPCDGETAQELRKTFLEIVIAPSFTDEALAILTKKKDLRLLAVGDLSAPGPAGYDVKRVAGGYLIQEWDVPAEDPARWRTVTEKGVDPALLADLLFAWKVVKHVKSNAIVVAKGGRTLGIGAGQMNRVDAARYALARAGAEARGAVLASDAFFPFPDVVEAAGAAGIAAIVQPGGSIRDEESIRKANELGVAMLFTGIRHFKH
ncbi:MAG: bifunctional phosphoribosylaminoimidazolecarboxamide formyltransferase/IMP cyclohydrolase [Firmicutes bacterium]|nr:bifunctional phosphoribosylaminoimidazolecarboxamide formyltransferase/IMP cyclohydrolase [Bacillota bacterium]